MFSPNTTRRLTQAAALANTAAGDHGGQTLPERLDEQHLADILADVSPHAGEARPAGAEPSSSATLRSVRKLRAAIAGIWHDAAAEDAGAALAGINHLLSAAGPVQLILPGGPDGERPGTAATAPHAAGGPAAGSPARTPAVLDAGREGDPAEKELSTAFALALTDVALAGELTRLRTCSGEACDNAFVDLTRNRSKQFCDEANCANRAHVRAYRARRAAEAGDEETGAVSADRAVQQDAVRDRAPDGEGTKPGKKAKKDKGKKKSKKHKK
ncbi:CGNR zinc finger domain-containing protein [Micrococcus sp. TA1]|uniref:CGNR zinc finger domain-containing protein n=1 Tax=Micrococcus sp. TA1 TaxID=681627 RepID=UPI001618243D|nr:CGNR zinc finger domain-containing protein [Micrococcus sp. TA1]MBB5750522.1 putative RNA-binding Zn ribbon-like protein [Micrococcus sp. TA1]